MSKEKEVAMNQKKKRSRVGYDPMGTPGMGPGQHHRTAARLGEVGPRDAIRGSECGCAAEGAAAEHNSRVGSMGE